MMKDIAHESGAYHVTGEAQYIDDLLVNQRLLHGRVVYSKVAHGKIVGCSIEKAKKLPGVRAILTYQDIPGDNQMGPIFHDELVLAKDRVTFVGQAILLIAAESEEIAIEAERMIEIKYEELPSILSIRDAIEKGKLIQPARKIETGSLNKAFAKSDHYIEGELEIGGQEQWYLETQITLALPGEGKELLVYSSTQHPSETQALIAKVMGLPKMEVEVQIRRMGGAFGGKETQANHVAIWTCLLSKATGTPVKIRLFRDDDQKMTGKRHRFLIQYKVGYGKDGTIDAIKVVQHTDAGAATDLTMAILERAMMHAENAYFIPNMKIIGKAWFTNLPSNTAFRGFGGPQGMACIEQIIDRIARKLKKDAYEIRKINFYQGVKKVYTPYGQKVKNNRLEPILKKLLKTSKYKQRRKAINTFNANNEFFKKGMAITPVKFGISFTTSFLNQAGALVHIYKDGTVLVNHGGTEMGQGLHTKISQISALELGIDIEKVKVNATSTAKVPNTSATAASAGTDLNGMAVKNAMDKLKKRIGKRVCDKFNEQHPKKGKPSKASDIRFKNNTVYDMANPKRKTSFTDAVLDAYFHQVSLSTTGYYKTPGIYFDREKGKGKPYYYFSFGMAVTEVLLDTLTGHFTNLRTDILHDVGDSINQRMDFGQIEGGYIQGMGWCTTEELKWDEKGNLLNHSPDTYKIPNIQDIPKDFRVALLKGFPNAEKTIRRSKAIAEPPLMLALSCWLAIKDAISAVGNHLLEPLYSLPATNEAILLSIDDIKKRNSS